MTGRWRVNQPKHGSFTWLLTFNISLASVCKRRRTYTMSIAVKHVAYQLFLEVRHAKEQHGRLTDELLSALQCVFQRALLPALDLVDQKNVTRLVCPSGRILYQVVGSSGQLYSCLSTTDFCTCPSYTFTVLVKMESIMCKHLLALHLAEVLGVCKEKQITDQEFAAYLL